MKVLILAGGLPSTLADHNESLPKPMVEIGERPLLWHIMKLYSHYGYDDFIICAGYKGDMIKRYFTDYYIYQSDVTIDLETNRVMIHKKRTENWKVTVLDTGRDTSIVQRVRKARKYVGSEDFIVAYGDCISDIDVSDMVSKHRQSGVAATVAAARPAGRNAVLPLNDEGGFSYDNRQGGSQPQPWVNACNMVFSEEIFHYLGEKDDFWENSSFPRLAKDSQIQVYKHAGFWSAVETKRDQYELEQLWKSGNPPWRLWKDETLE